MERSTFWARIALATGSASVLLLVAGTAHAGVSAVTQIHSFKVSGTIFTQDVSEKTGDDILDKDKFSEKLLGANCLDQEKLEKGQFPVIVFFDACGIDPDHLNDNEIQIITKEPPSAIAIGEIDFDVASQIIHQKKGVDSTRTMPATVELSCLGTVSVDVEASAIATVKLDSDGACVESVKLKSGSGTGIIDGVNVILDRVKMDAKKPSD